MKRSTWWLLAGIVSLVGGVFALLNPLAGSLAAEFLAAWAFLIMGVVQLVAVFVAPGKGNKVWLGIMGALATYVGISLFSNPLSGIMTLSLVLGVAILASGVIKLLASFEFRGTAAFWSVLLSAAVSILLGGMILSNFPQSAMTILGIILGVDLVFNGFSLIGLSRFAKSAEAAIGG